MSDLKVGDRVRARPSSPVFGEQEKVGLVPGQVYTVVGVDSDGLVSLGGTRNPQRFGGRYACTRFTRVGTEEDDGPAARAALRDVRVEAWRDGYAAGIASVTRSVMSMSPTASRQQAEEAIK